MGEWQPIETAPKDASEIILGIAGKNGCSFTGYWEDQPNYWGEIGFHDECWRQGGFYSEHPSNPTHWQPLPQPPESP